MNTHTEYRRHSYRPPEQAPTAQDNEAAVNQLAHHRDPSLASNRAAPATGRRGIAWVRPTELATYAAPLVGRGIDLQAELIRRARRTPTKATHVIQRGLSRPVSPPTPVNGQEGLQL